MIPILPNPHDGMSKEKFNTFTKMFTKEDGIDNRLCDEIIKYGQENVKPIENRHSWGYGVNNVEACFLPIDHSVHKELGKYWKEAIEFFNFDVSFIEPYEIKKYPTGSWFDRHIDNYHGNDIPVDRKISLSLQLTHGSEYTGGDVVVSYHTMSRNRVSLNFFPSYYPHHISKITSGTRWVLIAWAWGPYWK